MVSSGIDGLGEQTRIVRLSEGEIITAAIASLPGCLTRQSIQRWQAAWTLRGSSPRVTLVVRKKNYFTACGLSGEPVPPVMMSGEPQKKNS